MPTLTVASAGNPNAGKSTLFNALTGARQSVGNWPGVTVERRAGFFIEQGVRVEVVDLPGTYALTEEGELAVSRDEQVACEYLLSQQADLVINVLDTAHLERSLYLTVQLRARGVPLLVVANRMGQVARQGRELDCVALSASLGCPVIPMTARGSVGLAEVRRAVMAFLQAPLVTPPLVLPCVREGEVAIPAEEDTLRAEARYQFAHAAAMQSMRQITADRTLTRAIDRFVLNRLLGIPLFLLAMYATFFFALNVGGAFQDFFDIASETVFVGGVAQVLAGWGVPAWGIAVLANGVGKGIHTTLTFVPVLASLFFFLALLEDSGYMARAAFVVDRLMRWLGLPGKSLVPVIVGFGCNVPAIMAARTLESGRDRILTVMMMPFVPCGARLAIFTVFVAAFFPHGGSNVVFCLYLIGVVMAMLTGYLLRRTVLLGEPSPLVMELPAWLLPSPKALLLQTWRRLRGFVIRAGQLIVPVCMLIGALNAFSFDGSLSGGEAEAHSVLAAIGRWLTPLFAPMGLTPDNWPATVGLLTGVLAKEVVMGTLNTLYAQASHLAVVVTPYDFWAGWHEAVASIPANFAALSQAFLNPVLASAPAQSLSQSVYGVMFERFHGQPGAFAYLLFVLLYFPCVSTLAVMWREVGWRWTLFSVGWSISLAYVTAVGFYQIAHVPPHPGLSVGALAVIVSIGWLLVPWMQRWVRRVAV